MNDLTKVCRVCLEEKSFNEFYRHRSSKDGIQATCKECQRDYHRDYYRNTSGARKSSKKYAESDKGRETIRRRKEKRERDGRKRATLATVRAVSRGDIPRAAALPCSECGEPAADYHHHKGYDDEYILDVIPLCRSCHVAEHYRLRRGKDTLQAEADGLAAVLQERLTEELEKLHDKSNGRYSTLTAVARYYRLCWKATRRVIRRLDDM